MRASPAAAVAALMPSTPTATSGAATKASPKEKAVRISLNRKLVACFGSISETAIELPVELGWWRNLMPRTK